MINVANCLTHESFALFQVLFYVLTRSKSIHFKDTNYMVQILSAFNNPNSILKRFKHSCFYICYSVSISTASGYYLE